MSAVRRRGHRRVQRIRRDRDPDVALARRQQLRSKPVALGADEQRDRPPLAVAGSRDQDVRGVGAQRDAFAREVIDPARPGEPDCEDRAHARAHGLGRVRVGAARTERDARRAERVRGPQDRADVAGIADAVQIDTQRADRLAPALLVDPDHAGSRPERRGGAQGGGVDVVKTVAAEVGTGQPEAFDRLAPRLMRRADEILALDRKAPAARALAPVAQAPNSLQSGIVWGGDGGQRT